MTQANTGIDLSKYHLGWSDDEDYVFKPTKGLNEDLVREISWMKGSQTGCAISRKVTQTV